MAHVEYGCPNCEKVMYRSRTAVSSLDFKPLETLICKNCLNQVLWFEMLPPIRRGKLWLGGNSGAGEPFSVRLAGSANTTGAPVTTFTIPNVQVRSGEDLVVSFGTKSAVMLTKPTTAEVVWGVIDSTGEGQDVVFEVGQVGLAITYFFQNISPSTNDVVVSFNNASKPTDVAGVAFAATGLLLPDCFDGHAGLDNSVGSVAPVSGEMTPVPPSGLPTLLILCHVLFGDAVGDVAGSWVSPATRVDRSGTGNVICDVATRIINSPALVSVGKTGFTDRSWGLAASYALGT